MSRVQLHTAGIWPERDVAVILPLVSRPSPELHPSAYYSAAVPEFLREGSGRVTISFVQLLRALIQPVQRLFELIDLVLYPTQSPLLDVQLLLLLRQRPLCFLLFVC